MSSVNLTTNFSILVQILIGLITFNSIFFKVKDEDKILIEILKIETIVQLIELYFYIVILKNIPEEKINKMASIRYFDWFFTTPIMLLTTIIYFKYEEYKETKNNNKLTLTSFIKDCETQKDIIFIMICNFLMLLFGYLHEINYINKTVAFVLGFIFFYLCFYKIFKCYANKSNKGKNIFYIFVIVWSLYGFAFLLNSNEKNICYNILDIFSKNFFGLYFIILYTVLKYLKIC